MENLNTNQKTIDIIYKDKFVLSNDILDILDYEYYGFNFDIVDHSLTLRILEYPDRDVFVKVKNQIGKKCTTVINFLNSYGRVIKLENYYGEITRIDRDEFNYSEIEPSILKIKIKISKLEYLKINEYNEEELICSESFEEPTEQKTKSYFLESPMTLEIKNKDFLNTADNFNKIDSDLVWSCPKTIKIEVDYKDPTGTLLRKEKYNGFIYGKPHHPTYDYESIAKINLISYCSINY